MSKRLFIPLFILGFTSILSAQVTLPSELDTPEKRAKRLTFEMIKKLKLEGNQIDTIDALNYEYALIMQVEIFDKNENIWLQYRKGNNIMSDKDIYLEKLLSIEQIKRYKKMKNAVLYQILRKFF